MHSSSHRFKRLTPEYFFDGFLGQPRVCEVRAFWLGICLEKVSPVVKYRSLLECETSCNFSFLVQDILQTVRSARSGPGVNKIADSTDHEVNDFIR